MSETLSPSSSGSSSRAEVLSLRRVSHRLVMTPDNDLSRILQALLPRALLRMSQNEILLENDHNSSDENIQIVLKEIVTHALERIRGVDVDMPVTWVGEVASFLSSVCSFDDQHKPSHQNTLICDSRLLALDLLQESLLRLYRLQQCDAESVGSVLLATLQAIDWFHLHSYLSNQHLEGLFKASWVALDSIAVGNKHPPLFAFNRYLGDDNSNSLRAKGPSVPRLIPSEDVQKSASNCGVGMLHFFLDVITFYPDLSNSFDHNFEHWMRQRSIVTRHSLMRTQSQQPQSLSFFSFRAFQHAHLPSSVSTPTNNLSRRLQYRVNSDKIASGEEVRKEARNMKLTCYRYASLLFYDSQNSTSMKRALLLAVIARGDRWLSKEAGTQIRLLISSIQGLQPLRWSTESEDTSRNDFMTGLISSLLILVLKKETLTKLKQDMIIGADCKMDWEDILGQESLFQDHELPREAVSSVIEFTKHQLFDVSSWWYRLKVQDQLRYIDMKFLIELLFEVAKKTVGMLDFSPQLLYSQDDEAALCVLGAGLFRKLSEALLGGIDETEFNPNQTHDSRSNVTERDFLYDNRFQEYFYFVVRLTNLCRDRKSAFYHTTTPIHVPDLSGSSVDFKSNVLDSQLLSAPMQFRGECYHVIGAYMRRRNSLVPAPDDPTFYEIPGNLLICLMAEDDNILKEVIAASLHSVLHVYEAHLESDLACQMNYNYSLRVADFFPIVLSASCSYNPLIRLSAVKCVSRMIRFFDQNVSAHIFNFLLDDVCSEVATASAIGISQLKVTPLARLGHQNNDISEYLSSSKDDVKTQLVSQPFDVNKGKCDYCFQFTSIGHDIKCYADPSRQSSLRFFRKLDFPRKVQADSFQKRIAEVIKMYDDWSASTDAICVTKPCPNCNGTVKKKHGFNHVKCMTCGIGFCWICCKRINSFCTTSHTCSKFDPNNEKSWIFFLQRYKAQDLSESFALNQLDELHDADSDMRLGENFVTSMRQSVHALIHGRQFLKELNIRMYLMHDEASRIAPWSISEGSEQASDNNYEISRLETLESVLQVYTEKLNQLTEIKDEEEIMHYGQMGIPIFPRSLSLYTHLVLHLLQQIEKEFWT